MNKNLLWIILSSLIVFCLTFNLYGGWFLSTVAILLLYGMVLVAKDNLELSLIPIILVFLSSMSKLHFVIGSREFPFETIHNIFFFLCMIKLVLKGQAKLEVNNKYVFVFLFYIVLLQTFIIKISQGLALFSQMFVALKACEIIANPSSIKDNNVRKLFSIILLMSLIGEYIYGTITPRDIQTYNEFDWRASQFPGIYDPNNCSIHFLIGLIFLLFYKECYNKKIRIIILLFYSYVILLTVSFSGFVGLLVFLFLMFYEQAMSRNKKILIIGFVTCAILFIFVVHFSSQSNIADSSIPGLSALKLRLDDMESALKFGDMNELTSNREYIRTLYYDRFLEEDILSKFFGDPLFFKYLFNRYHVSSHNFYLDILIQYGYLGIGLLLISIFSILIRYVRKGLLNSFVVALWFVVLFYTRTLPEYFIFFTILIHNTNVRKKSLNICYNHSI